MVAKGNPCTYCNTSKCRNCAVPFSNENFHTYIGGKDDYVAVEIIWDFDCKGIDLKYLNKCIELVTPQPTSTTKETP